VLVWKPRCIFVCDDSTKGGEETSSRFLRRVMRSDTSIFYWKNSKKKWWKV